MTATPKTLVAYVYNPDNQTREQLIDSFVVRVKKFQRVYSEIKTTPGRFPVQHYVIEGKRGMGKTTFLLRLAYEIEGDTDLNGWLLPLVFNEEEYSIRKLYKLWERVAKLLGEKDKAFAGLFDEMDGQFERHPPEDTYEEAAFGLLTKRLQEKGKKIILFIDNFGDIFSRFTLRENQRLRTILQTSPDLQIIAASSVVLEAFFEYKHPFYEFFKVIRLPGLSREETDALLLKLGETYKKQQIKDILLKQPGRVEALRRLTGGVIRTVVLLFEIFTGKQDGNAFDDLEAILDRVSPLYKHRMDDLPTEQADIVNAVALAWDAMTAEEISRFTRLPAEVVETQLASLVKNEIFDRMLNPNGQHLYSVSERFFNIWYLMRHGRKGDKRRVLWLVRFLEEWCDEMEIVKRAQEHIAAMKGGTFNERGAYYMTEALAQARHLPMDTQHELIAAARGFLEDRHSEFVQYLSESDVVLHERAMKFYEAKEYQKALDLFLEMKERDEFSIATCYYRLKDFRQAEHYYLQAVEKGDDWALHNLANMYAAEYKNYPKAELFYIKAMDGGLLYDELIIKKYSSILHHLTKFLLSRSQYQVLYHHFTSPKAEELHLKDRLKPLWYALMYYMQDEHPTEYLRMGDELKETVQEIIAEVEEMRKRYGAAGGQATVLNQSK